MSNDKDKFSQLVEEKIKDFEVPYNSAHWEEMSTQLKAHGPFGGGATSNISKILMWSAAASVVIVGAWYLINKSESKIEDSVIPTESVIEENNISNNSQIVKQLPATDQESKSTDQEKEIVTPEAKIVNSDVTLDKYAKHSENLVKEESKNSVEQMLDEQKQTFVNEPKIDNKALKTSIIVNSKLLCEGEDVDFKVNQEIEGVQYYWNFGDNGLTSRKMNPTHKFKKAGNYRVTLLISKGEKNSWKEEIDIEVKNVPNISIVEGPNLITLNDPYAHFEAEGTGDFEFTWEFNSNAKANGRSVKFEVPDRGTYEVKLHAEKANSCPVNIDYTYRASKGIKMIVENTLTMNHDGLNDEFMPKELMEADVDFIFTIRDKEQRIVFETKDKYNPWNGQLNNSGSPLPADFYFWKVSFTDDFGIKHNQDGKIRLMQ